jgi:PEP-CTERM motif
MATVSGAILSAPLAVLMATGFDARTLAGAGTLQLVSPAVLEGSSLGDMPIMLTLRVTFVPEPATGLLLGAGLAVLARLSRSRAARG